MTKQRRLMKVLERRLASETKKRDGFRDDKNPGVLTWRKVEWVRWQWKVQQTKRELAAVQEGRIRYCHT